MSLYEELQQLLRALESNGVTYALCGGLAMAVYGIVRATEDIDLLVEETGLPQVRAVAESLGFRLDKKPLIFKQGQIKIHGLLKATAGEDFLLLDLLLVTSLTHPAWATRHSVETAFGPLQVVSPAGLIQLKSLRRSGQDEDDIRQLKELSNEA